tara:strand:+ start:149 stop:1051 length:903 start_codon:yes stop_codon:yes gene_type:complete
MVNSLEESEPKFEQIGVHKEPIGPNEEQTEPPNVQKNSTPNQCEIQTISKNLCTVCNKKFSKLKNHVKVCKGPIEDRYKCGYCGHKSKHASHLKRHLKTCKFKMKHFNDQLQVENTALQEQIAHLSTNQGSTIGKVTSTSNGTVTNNTTNNTTNTTNNNITNNISIVLNCFGKENLGHITHDYLKNLICGPFTSTSEIIKRIHFDINHPENANVKIPNKKLPWAEVYHDDKWMVKKKRDVLEGMVDTGFNIIDEAYHDIDPGEITGFQKDIYDDYQKRYKTKNSFRKQLVQDAEMVVLNH